jgi:hypothetical protein
LPSRAAALLLLLATAGAAPAPEVLREEAYNYRIVGELPPGWQRRGGDLAFVYAVDGIPHAYVNLARARLDGAVDVAEQLKQRAPHYRFPGAADGTETVRAAPWAGRDGLLLEHEAVVNGVRCRRRVAVVVAAGIWYERIETVYGETTEEIAPCREGLEAFRTGFRLLAEPLAAAERDDPAEKPVASEELGFRLVKPEGFRRLEVDLEADPGLRVAFERRLDDRRRGVLVRLFEYGVPAQFEAKGWLDNFFGGFSAHCAKAARAPAGAPQVAGAAETVAERFTGEREGRPIEELVVLVRAGSGRVLCLRVRSSGGAADELRAAVDQVLQSFAVE